MTTTTTTITPRTTWASQYQKGEESGFKWGKRLWGFGMQWHQLDNMQAICTSLQTDNHTNTLSLNIFRPDALSDAQPTVAKHWRQQWQQQMHRYKTQPLGLLMYFQTISKGENSELKKSTEMNHITVSTIAIAIKRRWCEELGLQRRSNGVIYMVSIQYMT